MASLQPFCVLLSLSSALGRNLSAGDQNSVTIENGLCDTEEVGDDVRGVMGVHGGLVEEPLICGEDGRVRRILRDEEADRVWFVEADVFGDLEQGAAYDVLVTFLGADDGGDGQHVKSLD